MNYISEKTTPFIIPRKKLVELQKKKTSKEYIREKEALETARCKNSELGEYVYNIKLL